MRSSRITHATERDSARFRPCESELPTLSDDGTLLQISRLRSVHALSFRRRRTLSGMARAAGRRVLSFLGLM